MRIGLDISPLQNGHRWRGIGQYARGLLRGLSAVGPEHEYWLVYWQGVPLCRDGLTLPPRVRWLGVPYPRWGRLSTLAAQQVFMPPRLLGQGLDLFHQLGVVVDPVAGGPPLLWAGRTTVTVHDLTPLHFPEQFFTGKRLRRLNYAAMLRAVRAARRVLTDSEATRGDVLRRLGLAPERVRVIPLAVDESFRPRAAGEPPGPLPAALGDAPYLLQVGGDLPNKNLGGVLESYAALCAQEAPPYRLVVLGPDGPHLARFRTARPDLAARVVRLGGLSQAEVVALYQRAACLVCVSRAEGFGLPMLEAMACAVPVVAANVSSLPEVAGDAARLVPPDQPAALAAAIQAALAPGQREALVAAGLRRAAGYRWERTAELTLVAYREVACGAR